VIEKLFWCGEAEAAEKVCDVKLNCKKLCLMATALQLLMFSLRLESERLQLSTRLFRFDWSVAFSVSLHLLLLLLLSATLNEYSLFQLFSATCSYLFILLQFEQPKNVHQLI
jgi:hypothetical protein